MIIYNPVVKKGLFRVDYKDLKKLYTATDEAEAKYKLIEEFSLFPAMKTAEESIKNKPVCSAILQPIKVTVIKKTVRKNDVK